MLSLQFDQYYHVRKDQKFSEMDAARGLLDVSLPEILGEAGFVKLPDQDLSEMQEVASRYRHFSEIVLIGLGGSSLGPKALVEALGGLGNQKPVHFLDNVDPGLLESVRSAITLENTLFLVVTKSGNTPETLALFYYFEDQLRKTGLDPHEHCVLITDPEKGHLRTLADTGYTSLPVPPEVGGRFSVLTNVGLLLAELLGLSAEELLSGAGQLVESAHTQPAGENAAYKLALFHHLEYQAGRNIHVLMSYDDRLREWGQWATQLYSESLGKRDVQGESVGFTPHPARGVSDQHSQLQLFQEGPDDKAYLFCKVRGAGGLQIPELDAPELDYLSGRSFEALYRAEYEATVESLVGAGRPCVRLSLDSLDEYHLGALFMLLELTTAYLGHLLEVNAYDQPGVEESKRLTKQKLSQ